MRSAKDDWFNMMRNGKEKHLSHDVAEECIFEINPESILDVGVGPGVTYERIRERIKNIKYVGVDISQIAINKLSEMYGNNIFVQGSLMNLPMDDNSFDVCYTRHTLEHCEYYEKPILELFRVAKKRVIITLFHELINDDKIVIKSDRYLNYYDRSKFINFIKTLSSDYTEISVDNNIVIIINKE